MRLNTIKPAIGEKQTKHRVGRGCGCGWGKTCGRGHKGQTSRSGYSRKLGFEGGQTPIQRRLPKFGFSSLVHRKKAEIRLGELNKVTAEIIDIKALREAGLIGAHIESVKIILSGELNKAVELAKDDSIKVTKGALAAIEKMAKK